MRDGEDNDGGFTRRPHDRKAGGYGGNVAPPRPSVAVGKTTLTSSLPPMPRGTAPISSVQPDAPPQQQPEQALDPGTEATILGLLNQRLAVDDDAGIQERDRKLTAVFRAIPSDARMALHDRLFRSPKDDELATAFSAGLNHIKRVRLLGVLRGDDSSAVAPARTARALDTDAQPREGNDASQVAGAPQATNADSVENAPADGGSTVEAATTQGNGTELPHRAELERAFDQPVGHVRETADSKARAREPTAAPAPAAIAMRDDTSAGARGPADAASPAREVDRAGSEQAAPPNRAGPVQPTAPADRSHPVLYAAPADRADPVPQAAPQDRAHPVQQAAPARSGAARADSAAPAQSVGVAHDAAAAGLRGRASIDQPDVAFKWVQANNAAIIAAFSKRLAAFAPPAAAGVTWMAGGLGVAFPDALVAALAANALFAQLPELMYPSNVWYIIDRERPLVEGQAGVIVEGREPSGPLAWHAGAGDMLSMEMLVRLRESLARMVPRFAVQLDAKHPQPVTVADLVTSHPLDRVTAHMLCDPRAVKPARPTGKHARRPSADPALFAHGVRMISDWRWLGDQDPQLWNWVEVKDPIDARVEEVAATLWLDPAISERAYMITAATPFFRVEPSWARQLLGDRAPPVTADPPHQDNALVLARSAHATDAAIAQGADERKRDKRGVPLPPDFERASKLLEQSQRQLVRAEELVTPWGVRAAIWPAAEWVAKYREHIYGLSPERAGALAPVFEGQQQILFEAVGALQELAPLHARNADGEQGPLTAVIRHYAIAIGESHLIDTARAQLAIARQHKAGLTLALLERATDEGKTAVRDLAATERAGSGYGGDAAAQRQTAYQQQMHDLRERASAGGALDSREVELLSANLKEHTLDTKVKTLYLRLQALQNAARDSTFGMAETIASMFGDAKEVVRKTTGMLTDLQENVIVSWQREKQARMNDIAGRQQDPQARAWAINYAADLAQQSFTAFSERTAIEPFIKGALANVQRQQEITAIVQIVIDIALLIGVSVVGGMAGQVVAGAVRGAIIADAATASLGAVRTARAAGTVAGLVTDAAINAGGQVLIQGGKSGKAFFDNLLTSGAVLAALRPLHNAFGAWGGLNVDAKNLKLWARAGLRLRQGVVITAEMITAGAISYAVERARAEGVPDEETALSWTLRGATMVVGRVVAGRMQKLEQRLARLAEHGGAELRTRAARTRQLASKAEETGEPELAMKALEERHQLLTDEAALLERLADQPDAKLSPDARRQLAEENRGDMRATEDAALASMPLRTAGLVPDDASGKVWAGTPEQIAHAKDLARRTGMAITDHSHDAGRSTVFHNGQELTLIEISSRSRPSKAERARPVRGTSDAAPDSAGDRAAPRNEVHHLGLQLAQTAGNTRYTGDGVFEIDAGGRVVPVEVKRTSGAVAIKRRGGGVVIHVPKGLTGAALERAVVGRLVEVQHQELRVARGETASANSDLGAKGTGQRLSPADMRTVAELRMLRQQRDETAARGEDPALIQRDIDALETRLGLRDTTPRGEQRRAAVEAQIEVQSDAGRRARAARELEGHRGHPGIEVHAHFTGIVEASVFRERAVRGTGQQDTGSWIPLLERIAQLKGKEFQHERAGNRITKRAPAGDAVEIAVQAQKQVDDLQKRARAAKAEGEGQDEAAFLRGAEAVAEEACQTALRATPETDFNSAYEIRDQLIKDTFGTQRGEPVDAQARYDDFIEEAVLQLARDGIGYSEQSTGLRKLNGVLNPRRIQAVIDRLVKAGKLLPGQVEVRMLSMLRTSDFGERERGLPRVDGQRDRSESAGDVDTAERQRREPGNVGKDIGGPEHYEWDARAEEQFTAIYHRMLDEATRTGSPGVFRPHVGEGAIDTVEGKPFHTDKDRATRGHELAHYERARKNIDRFLATLEKLRAAGSYDVRKVIIRLGHVTHATPEQAARMQSLGVMAEVQLGSNVATGALNQTEGVHGPRSAVERLDDHALPTMLYYDVPIALNTDSGPVMGTTLRGEYQRARNMIEEVLAGARPVRVRAEDAWMPSEKRYRGKPSPNRDGQYELGIHDLTPEERARFLRGYEKLYADVQSYYQRRPKPRGAGAASPAGGAHRTDLALQHGLVSTIGTAAYEGTRGDVERAAAAYRGALYFVTEQAQAGGKLVVVVQSPDGDFETTLRSWGGEGPSHLPFADLGPLDAKLSNLEVRNWYKAAIARVEPLDKQWRAEGVPIAERARRSYEIRHHARLAARELMESRTDVNRIELRDLFEYGDTDGPSFDGLMAKYMSGGRTREQAYQAIIDSAPLSNKQYDRRSGMKEPKS